MPAATNTILLNTYRGYRQGVDSLDRRVSDGLRNPAANSTKKAHQANWSTWEGDIYDLFAERERIVQRGEIAADWLIRSKHDRKTEEGRDNRKARPAHNLRPPKSTDDILASVKRFCNKTNEKQKTCDNN